MPQEKYEGWSNQETWWIAQHIDNDAQDMAQHSELEPQTGNTIVDCCTRCGGPIDHNEPHTYCQNCA